MFVQIFLLACLCYLLFLKDFSKRKRMPPGPRSLPIIGSILELNEADPNYSHLAMGKLAEKYGDIMSLGFGMHSSVVISSFEMMKELFKRHEVNTARFEYPYVLDRAEGKNLGIIWSHGTVWRDVRRYTMRTLRDFGYGKANSMEQSMTESQNDLIRSINSDVQNSSDGMYNVNPHNFSIHVLNILWNLVGGYKFDVEDVMLQRNMELGNKLIVIMGHTNSQNAFPFLRKLFPAQMQEHLQVHQETRDFMKILINDAKEKRKMRLDSHPTSFIEAFLDEIDNNDGNPNTIFTQEQLELVLMDLFLAGSETTGTVLTWGVLFMMLNPKVQGKVREEIRQHEETEGRPLLTTDFQKMPYTRSTILEILRLGNMVPVPAPRCVSADIEFDKYIIPKGTALFFNLHTVLQNKEFWGDPSEFRPQRFLDESGTVDKKMAERAMSVFGFGTRVCFGESLALDSLFMLFVALVKNFQFDSIPGNETAAENPISGLAIRPRPYSVKVRDIN